MSAPVKKYTSNEIDVTYDAKRCIHAAECVRGLPSVFNTQERPWIQPANASADAVATVVQQCPSGALHFIRQDSGSAEATPSENIIAIQANGPLYVRGDVQITLPDGKPLDDTRMALCRCGASENKPFCDNSHKTINFSDPGQIGDGNPADVAPTDQLTINPSTNGPYLLRGNFELVSAAGETIFRGEKAALCRCGGSSNKPFCDGTHKRIHFNTQGDE